jgi:hypothetical protein
MGNHLLINPTPAAAARPNHINNKQTANTTSKNKIKSGVSASAGHREQGIHLLSSSALIRAHPRSLA